jgi:hypothetical protein
MQMGAHLVTSERTRVPFGSLPRPSLFASLRQGLADAVGEFRLGPALYLKQAFLPDASDWLPYRLVRAVVSSVRHPFQTFSGIVSPGSVEPGFISPDAARSRTFLSKRKKFEATLAVSGFVHVIVLAALFIYSIIAPFMGWRVVDKPYGTYKRARIIKPLYLPAEALAPVPANPLPLDVAQVEEERRRREREEERKRKAEEERKRREEQARREAELAKAAEKTETPAADSEEKKDEEPGKYGEFNERAIKDLIGEVYEIFTSGRAQLKNEEFSVVISFKINRDGSLSNLNMVKSSGDAIIDEYAMKLLWLLGKSNAVGPLHKFSSNTISFDLTKDIAELKIVGFAPSAQMASQKASELKNLIWLAGLAQQNPDAKELMRNTRIRSEENRLIVNLAVSRARADSMMRAQYEKKP